MRARQRHETFMERLDIIPRQCPERLACNCLDSRKGILHPMIEFIEKQLKPFFGMLLLSDVRVSAKPSKHSALIVFQWLHA